MPEPTMGQDIVLPRIRGFVPLYGTFGSVMGQDAVAGDVMGGDSVMGSDR